MSTQASSCSDSHIQIGHVIAALGRDQDMESADEEAGSAALEEEGATAFATLT
eukprot:CAMPEP_0115831752 /NCGR_PEP_ID=MMETSP0287-20121206/2302_1 /TAXON_ID=412157 /ORGANISM="Chrysochromulina rotalis, Strain UIO044" /LENGTH=52 /DNA_ID=CAMNT_0003285111 /DNA_START=1202 /DNA_END=1360 /DNA_ORIENTATION=-